MKTFFIFLLFVWWITAKAAFLIIGEEVNDANISVTGVTQHEASIDHDALTNFLSNKHLDWTNETNNFLTTGTFQAATSTVTETLTVNSTILLGNQNAFGRNQIWNFSPNSILRLGSFVGDGDLTNESSQGAVIYGANLAGDPMDSGRT